MLGGNRADRADAAEHPGAAARPAHVELGELVRRALPADRQHEREGGRLHDDRRRPEGALSVIANVPKTVVMALLERLQRALRLRGHRRDARHRARAGAGRRQVAEHELMPFPVLDACFHLYAGEKMSPDEVVAALGSLFPRRSADAGAALGGALHEALHAVDLQVGAVAALAARRLPRSRSRARAADAGRAEDGVDTTKDREMSSKHRRRSREVAIDLTIGDRQMYLRDRRPAIESARSRERRR